jgi:phenylacetate-CoA ligase
MSSWKETNGAALVTDSQFAKVARAVPRWLERVPLYRQSAAAANASSPDFAGRFNALPIITKRDIREGFPQNFLPPGTELDQLLDRDLVELERTSGTSEEPTPLILGRGWWHRQEEIALRLNPLVNRLLTADSRRVTLVSPVCGGEICYSGIPSHADRVVGNALFLNLSRHPFFWTEKNLARMAREATEWEPEFLDIDPVYGVLFALYCERQGVRLPALKFIVSSYEYLSAAHRRILGRAFQAPVFNLYGSTETGHLLMEDELGRMRPSLPTAFLELAHGDANGVGDLVVTTLSNEFMPLIRYSIGDLARASLTAAGETVFELQGRGRDALRNRDGARVTVAQVDRALADWPGLVHYQLRQLEPDRFTLYYVPETAASAGAPPPEAAARLAGLFPGARLEWRAADHIPCENSGKFRLCLPIEPV